MAYKQSPGRGNKAKTGNGVPSAFLQTIDGPATEKMKAQVAKKETKGLTFAEQTAAKKFASGAAGTGVMGNTKMNPMSGETEVKPSGNKLVKQEGGNMMIVNSAGKTIASAKGNRFNSKETDALTSKFNKDEASYKDYATANTIAQNSKLKAVR